MVTKKQILPTILLLLWAFSGFSQVYDQKLEQHKAKTKDALFQLVSAIGDRISDATLTPEEQQQLLDPIVGYAHKEQPIFLQLRKKYLQHVPAPPAGLLGLPFHRVRNYDIIKAMGDPRFMTITLLQCYRPAEMGSVVNGMFLADIHQATGTSVNEASIAYTFGRQIFAKKIQGDEWQIWLANRAYAFRFNLDLNTMTVSDPEYTVPNIPAYLQLGLSFFRDKQPFETDALYQEMDSLRWNAYSMDLLRDAPPHVWQESTKQTLRTFYAQHQPRFLAVQRGILKGLPQGVALDSSWQELQDFSAEERQLLNQALQPYVLHPDEAAYQLFSVTNGLAPFNQNVNEIGKNAMAGFRHYTFGEENTEIRRIRSQGYSLAFEYDWNLKNGSFSNLRVFTRQVEPTPPTAVN